MALLRLTWGHVACVHVVGLASSTLAVATIDMHASLLARCRQRVVARIFFVCGLHRSGTGACCGLSPVCERVLGSYPDVPAAAAIDVHASACCDHVAGFSLEYEGIFACWRRSEEEPA